jgi:hypothetical protein
MTSGLIKRSHSGDDVLQVQVIIADIQTAFNNLMKAISAAAEDLGCLVAETDDGAIAKAKSQLSSGDLPSALKTLKHWQSEMEADMAADEEEQAALEANLDAEHAAAEAA